MGYTAHHAIIITGYEDDIAIAHVKARQLFDHVSNLVPSPLNHYISFFVAPDGSIKNWEDSDIGDDNRRELIEFLREKDLVLDYVEVCYGGDLPYPAIVDDDEIYGD
jgi:hypothetical protein